MGLFIRLAAVKGLRKKVEGGCKRRRRGIVKSAGSRSATFEEIPEEVLIEILARLPAKSVMRFKCVSKHWSSLISSRYFTNLFFQVSSPKREPRVFMFLSDNEHLCALLSNNNNFISDSYPHLNQDLTMPGMGGCFVNALRGLMCFRVGREVRICNLTTRQLLKLPRVKSNILDEAGGEFRMWNYFGHDSVHDEYKVLSTVCEVNEEERVVRSEHKVLILGLGAYWRSTQSTTPPPPPHRPYSQGISINGVLYYGAWVDKNTCVLMSFDLTSEEFSLIELPIEASIVWHVHRANLMIYESKIAVFEYSRLMTECILDLWVVEDAGKSKWSHKAFVLPSHQLMQCLSFDVLLMHNTGRSRELRLSGTSIDRTKVSSIHAIYDLEKNGVSRGVVIGALHPKFSGTRSLHTTLWDDVESIMCLKTLN
ncbi:PREDICTED: putative F-box protein At3g52320 isoform X2 [Camelina sativa]|uniref:F-box protein At3g52320 isoform X2 n=1 Tax=Camelina sativa TaxID=90675 RepID=A0ABM0YPE6_CAMSA|nr:PREDICTED: putative F-box protein At3g52320 isoform X2 [Camelina sativa]